MKFVHPEILWALSAIAIPIIVHLFNFRKFKKVLFSNVAFLQEIQQETKSKSKFKHLLILASRILAITCLVFAFAQPYFPTSTSEIAQGDKAISIYVDNSFSMDSKADVGSVLEITKNKAIAIISAHSSTDKFQVFSNEFDGAQQRFLSQDEAIEAVQKIQHTPVIRKWSEVYSRQQESLLQANQKAKLAYCLSDFQANVSDLENVIIDSTFRWKLVPAFASLNKNISIDSVWFDAQLHQLGLAETLHIKVKNYSTEERNNVPVSVEVNGMQKGVTSVEIPANASFEFEISFSPDQIGSSSAKVHVDDYPISFDDDYYFSFDVTPSIKVLEVKGNDVMSSPVETLFSGDAYFQLSEMTEKSIDYSKFSEMNLIVMNGFKSLSSGLKTELQKFISAGGSVMIFPSSGSDLESYNSFLNGFNASTLVGKMDFSGGNPTEVSIVNYDHPLFNGVLRNNKKSNEKIEFPQSFNYFKLQNNTSSSSSNILTLQNGDPFLTSSTYEGGKLYFCAQSLEKNAGNFTSHSFFPTLMIRAAELSVNSQEIAYFLEKEQAITLRNVNVSGDQTFRLKAQKSENEIIPEHRNNGGSTSIYLRDELSEAGIYNLSLGDSLIAVLSFNYSRTESDTKAFDIFEMQDKVNELGITTIDIIESSSDSIGKFAEEIEGGKKLWFTMIIWALIFLAIEILLIKYFGAKKQTA